MFKYEPYVSDLKKLLGEFFYEGLIQQESFYKALGRSKKPVLVPIPLHASRFRQRGYNQSELLAKEIGTQLAIPVANLLKRVRKTQTQVGLDQKDRKANIKDAFIIASKTVVSDYQTVFLVDDVLTSGSTLAEAAKVLKKSGVEKVWGLTLARD